jgi:hypothetical protein
MPCAASEPHPRQRASREGVVTRSLLLRIARVDKRQRARLTPSTPLREGHARLKYDALMSCS